MKAAAAGLLGVLFLLAAGGRGAAPPRHLVDAHGDPLPPGALARFCTSRLFHEGAVAAAFTQSGTRLISYSAASGGELRLWDAATGKLLRQRRFPQGKGKSLPTFSPDGGVLFVERDAVYRLADLDAPLTKIHAGKDLALRQGVVSPDGKLLAVGSAGGGLVLDLPDAEVWLRLEVKTKPGGKSKAKKKGGPPAPAEFAFSRDGRLLAFAALGEVGVLDAVARRHLFAVTLPATTARRTTALGDIEGGGLSFSPDGRRLLVTSQQVVRQVDAETGQDAAGFSPLRVNARLARFSADGKEILILDPRQLNRFDAATGRELAPTRLPFLVERSLQAPTISPERGRAAVIQGGVLRVVDLRTGESAHPQFGNRGLFLKLRWPRGDEVVCLTTPPVRSVDRWDARTGKPTSSRAINDCTALDLSRDGELAILWREGEVPFVRRLADGKRLWGVDVAEESGNVAFTPDGRWVVVSKEGMVHLRDARTGKARPGGRITLEPGDAPLAWSDCGRMLATFDGGAVKVHEFAGGAARWSFPVALARYARFSPDGTRLAVTRHDGVIQVFLLGRSKPLFEVVLPRHLTRDGGEVAPEAAAVFSPSGEYLAAVCGREARVWGRDGRPVGVCRGHQARVYDVAFSPDGRRLVTASEDGTCLVWDVSALAQ